MNLELLIHAEVIRADLAVANEHFSSVGVASSTGLLHLKMAFIALANVADLEPQIRPSYKVHADPATLFKPIKKNLEFAKYLRNKVVGHIHPQLVSKAIEWQPTLRHIPGRLQRSFGALMVNVCLFETAINTYVDESGNHKLFDSETDLMYPPDSERFFSFLQGTIQGSISYLESLMAFWAPKLAPSSGNPFDLEAALKAGRTEFRFLKQ
jgi:hypothetical protein